MAAGLAHTLRVLYQEASSTRYPGSTAKKHMLDQLRTSVARLPPEDCVKVLQVRTDDGFSRVCLPTPVGEVPILP